MTTTVVIVLCCNLLWMTFHSDRARVKGQDGETNESVPSLNVSRPIPVKIKEFDKVLKTTIGVQGVQGFSAVQPLKAITDGTSASPQGRSRHNTRRQRIKDASRSLKLNVKGETEEKIHGNVTYNKTFLVSSSPVASVKGTRYRIRDTDGLAVPPRKYEKHQDVKFWALTTSTNSPSTKQEETGKSLTPRLQLSNDDELTPSDLTAVNPQQSSFQLKLFKNTRRRKKSRSEKTTTVGGLKIPSTAQPSTLRDPVSTLSDEGGVWVDWGPCSVSCGTGTQERSRMCGPNCRQVESRECYLNSCHGIMKGVVFSDSKVKGDSQINSLTPYNQTGVPKQTFLDTEIDACAMWATCKDEYLQRYMSHLTELANCPCYYPFNLDRNSNVWDHNRMRYYKWVDINSTQEKLDIYKPSAYRCIRSLLFPGAATLAAQVCCYNDDLQLVTRGRNAGTPNLISPQISWELHYKIDILPWVICKGDWTRYNRVLPPNNMLGCYEYPDEDQLLEEAVEAQDY